MIVIFGEHFQFSINATCFLGTHSGYSHAAAALKKDAINIFGGWISPEIMGYKLHTNYYVDLTDSPCGSIQICNHCKNCMDQIKVEDIISSLEQKNYQ